MSTQIQDLHEQVASMNVDVEMMPALIELLWEKYEDEMDLRDAREARRQFESGEAATVSLDELMAEVGMTSQYKAS